MDAWSQEFPRQELVFQGRGAGFCLLLKRNCSITPAGLMCAYGLIAIMTMAIATALAVMGAWPILPFAGVEIVGLGIAFLMNGRHAADYERIELESGRLVVEVGESHSVRRHEFNRARASVMVAGQGHGVRVLLDEKPGRRVEIGRHLQEQARLDLAGELTKRLRN